MTTPRTPLLVAPDGEDNLLGQPILSEDLIRGLRRINPSLVVPAPQDRYQLTQFKGITTLWIGPPGAPGSKKICAFHLGAVPEWTQLDDEGVMITRGWRAIFEKVIRAGAATKHQLETTFKVSLSEDGSNTLCPKCVKEGRRERHNGGKARLCDQHEALYDGIKKGQAEAPEALARARHVRRRIYG